MTFLTFGGYLKQRFDCHVRKLSIQVSSTCPNRDGTLGIGGCTFCNNKSFVPDLGSGRSVSSQLVLQKENLRRLTTVDKFLAYFQAYTSTYGDIDTRIAQYAQALADPDVVGLAISTRPDCLPDAILNWLATQQQQGKEIWLELGLQSACEQTLNLVNRGHGVAAYLDAMERCRHYGLNVCTHLIFGLPNETREDWANSARLAVAAGSQGLKFHPLQYIRGTQLCRDFKQGKVTALTEYEYVDAVAEIIAELPKTIIYHRVTGDNLGDWLVAPAWSSFSRRVRNQINKQLAKRLVLS